MKKIFNYIFMAAAAIAAMSCIKEENPAGPVQNGELVHMTFTATVDAETKVFYDGESKTTQWKKGDEIAIITTSGASAIFTANTVSEDGFTAVFEGEIVESDDYYAVYPASAYKGNDLAENDSKKRLFVEVPAVQTAVAGTFDPSAFVSVAQTNNNTIVFKNICSVVKFSFNEATDIKSIRFTMNGNTNLAGNENIYVSNLMSHTWGDAFEGRTSSNMITLNAPAKGFEADTDYYFTLRPFTQKDENQFGINFYVEYNNGVKVRQGSNAFAAVRNTILPLGVIDAEDKLSDVTPYDAYNLGFDLVVGDKAYNKAVNGNGTKITATAENTSVYNQFNNGGIFFLETSENGSFNLHSNVAVKNDVVIVGNVNNGKVLIDMNGKNVNHTAKTVALKNLELDTDAYTNYVFANNNATADADAFILDNCSVTGLVKPLWYVNVAGFTLKNLTLADTDIALAAATNIIDLGKTTSSANKVVSIKNCILYGASNYVSRIINNTQGSDKTVVTWDADVIFENNTVYNLHAGTNNGLLHMSGANSVVFKNNLINFYSLNATEYVIRIWKNTPVYTVENNYFWARANSGIPSDLTFYSNVKVESAEANITSGAYPFTSSVPGAGATR